MGIQLGDSLRPMPSLVPICEMDTRRCVRKVAFSSPPTSSEHEVQAYSEIYDGVHPAHFDFDAEGNKIIRCNVDSFVYSPLASDASQDAERQRARSYLTHRLNVVLELVDAVDAGELSMEAPDRAVTVDVVKKARAWMQNDRTTDELLEKIRRMDEFMANMLDQLERSLVLWDQMSVVGGAKVHI